MIYFRCYIEDYDSATAELTLIEDGVYWRLMRHYYKTEAPIPVGREALLARALSAAERKAVQSVLARFFEKRKDGWHNRRADREISVAQQARENGSHGGRPKKPETQTETGLETGSETGIGESGYQSGGAKTPENETGLGQPYKPTSTKSPKSPTSPKSSTLAKSVTGGSATPPVTGAVWEAYSAAYVMRYGTEPVRNAKVNAQLSQLVQRLGADEAPQVAVFYLTHNRASYVRSNHAVGFLLADAEGLRTEWATARRVSETEARQADRTMATGNAFSPLIAEAKAGVA